MKRLNILGALLAIIVLGLTAFYIELKHLQKDSTPPEITIENDTIECSLDATDEELKVGLTAMDNKDGDLTSHIIVNDIQICEEKENPNGNEFNISYIVFDSQNNVGYASRKLIYSDYRSPRFHMSGPLRFGATSSVNIYEMVTADDCIDGDITNNISVEMSEAYLNAFSFGTYDCTISVTNSVGDFTSMPLQFEVVDTASEAEASRPEIYLKDYLVYIHAGDKFSKKSYLEGVVVDGDGYEILPDEEVFTEGTIPVGAGYSNPAHKRFITVSQIKINSNLNKDVPGIYTVEYSFKHPIEGTKGSAKLIVVVE